MNYTIYIRERNSTTSTVNTEEVQLRWKWNSNFWIERVYSWWEQNRSSQRNLHQMQLF